MADDLDELLDEVESRFCSSANDAATRRVAKNRSQTNRTSNACGEASKHDDIDGLIKDIFEDVTFDDEKVNTRASYKSSVESFTQTPCKRCCPVYLGGSSVPFGLGTNISQRTCSRLRCTACDFSVAAYDDYQWDKSCDYLFFRNSMPELEKLQSKMIRKRGSRAYACQCSWRSIQQLTDLQLDQQLRWVCGKHTE
ncbi:cilia- and flagella-associated protein 418 [Lissotriton helveticus]